MPFSSNPVYVGKNDNVQVRYPTPSTWNTQVTVNVQIGTGSDPDGITFGTKIPDALIGSISFTDQAGYTVEADNSGNTSGFVSEFQPNTTYYSNVVDISSIEIPVPATISAVSDGPKNNNTNNSTAQFRILRGGSWGSWRTSITANISNGTGGLQPGDKIQLKVTVPDWYVTSTVVTFVVGDETFGTNIPGQSSTVSTNTWGITTRQQDQDINQWSFQDRVDQKIPADGGNTYHTYDIDITGIDDDVVLRASSTANVQISADNSNWSQSINDQLVLGDTLYTRILNGPGYTTKTTGEVRVYAVGGDQYTRGSNTYENTTAGTYGAGNYQVTQTLGDVDDNWQNWTEVDRYPDSFASNTTPIYTYGTKIEVQQAGEGFSQYVTHETQGGSGTGMTIYIGVSFDDAYVVDPGYGYAVGDVIEVVSPTPPGPTPPPPDSALYTLLEYEKVVVSTTDTISKAEPNFYYFCDITVQGLGTEYASGTYSDLESPYTNLTNNNVTTAQQTVATLNGQPVVMNAIIDGTGGEMRKNFTGNWVQQLTVGENDVVTLKRLASSTFGATQDVKVRVQGPPSGPPGIGSPTGGPASPTYSDQTRTMTVVTRAQRNTPYPFHAKPVFQSEPLEFHIAEVKIDGLDVASIANITGGIGTLSIDEVNWGSSVTLQPDTEILYVRQESSATPGGLAQLTYTIGSLDDTFEIRTKNTNAQGDFVSLQWVGDGETNYVEQGLATHGGDLFFATLLGAGGGDGGGDAPNSTGGPGGPGNALRVSISIPQADWQTAGVFNQPTYKLRIYAADKGLDGADFVTGTGKGTGGFGYCYGGDGGNSGPSDSSGAGGGGGGASAISFVNNNGQNVLLALAGGGGGGAGSGNDTTIPGPEMYGNNAGTAGGNTLQTTTVNLNLLGDDAPNATGSGGGPGGGGGGYDGNAGSLQTQKLDDAGQVIQTTDLDATAGWAGGIYYNPTYCTLIQGLTSDARGAGPGESGSVFIEYSQQDLTPDAFGFDTIPAEVNSQYESSIEQITGVTGEVSVSMSYPTGAIPAECRVCTGPTADTCGSYGNGAVILNNQYLQLRATTNSGFFTNYTVTATVGTVDGNWVMITGSPPDDEPNAYFIPTVNDAEPNTVQTSEEVQISGINVPIDINSTNGSEIRVYDYDNTGITYDSGWINGVTGTTIENDQFFQVRITSAPDFQGLGVDTVQCNVNAGQGGNATFVVNNKAEDDTTPGQGYSFIPVTGSDLLTEHTSNAAFIDGLDVDVEFTVESGSGDQDPGGLLPIIVLNNVEQPANVSTVTVGNFDAVQLRYTTTDVVGEARNFNTKLGLPGTTAGYYERAWYVSNAGQFGTDPDEFTFQTQLAAGTGVLTVAQENGADQIITISGLANGVTIGLWGTNGVQFDLTLNGGWNTYTVSNQANVTNGSQFKVRLISSEIAGFSRTAQIYAGSYNTSYVVQSPANVADPISSMWYSALTPCKYVGNVYTGAQIRTEPKYDGLPIGTMMPVFQDATQSDGWGKLDGKADSRFPGWIYCDGGYYNTDDYPLLFETLEYEYGAKQFGADIYFRVPDMRNRYVKGTGVIDGNASSSPSLAPTFKANKLSGGSNADTPGAFGGMWYVEKIGDPGGELEQVIEPATGQPAQESEYFGIAQLSTTGYTDVSGLIEFNTIGKSTFPIKLDEKGAKIYEPPLHFHELVTGQADPGNFKGKVNWGGDGGYDAKVESPVFTGGKLGTDAADETSGGEFTFNLWGYATEPYTMDNTNLPQSAACPNASMWWDGSDPGNWSENVNPGLQGIQDVGTLGTVTLQQDGLDDDHKSEIYQYIDFASKPISTAEGSFGGDATVKYLGAVDIPRKEIIIKGYSPTNKLSHNHYVSLINVDSDDIFGYGNNDTGGTATTALSNWIGGVNSSVNLEFSAGEVGLQVLPGTFTLSQSKQLVPTPEFAPSDDVPLVSPYTWVKWLIKAY
ncbi:MAG: hypothetical protein CL961_03400 [Euryarchaeota archaeon]|nr:hypothetical protein [Euryarchaeota archaeon]